MSSNNVNDELEEIQLNDPVVKFKTNINLEQFKREFCNKNYEVFLRELFDFHENNQIYLLYGKYKYADEYDGRPFFTAKNRVNGFENFYQEYKKYLFVKFQVSTVENSNKYLFDSFWIVNSLDFLEHLKTNSDFDDFEFSDITYSEFTDKFMMVEFINCDKAYIKYLH